MSTISEQVTAISVMRGNLLQALSTDALNPQPSYSVGGQSVSRTEWRESLLRQIGDLNKMAGILQPAEVRSQIY
jgi:hypothetical protein